MTDSISKFATLSESKQELLYRRISAARRLASGNLEQKSDGERTTGPVPLGPLQLRFFEDPRRQDFTREIISYLIPGWQWRSPETVEQALRACIEYHDALRFRYKHTEHGWMQTCAALGESVPFTYVNVATLSANHTEAMVAAVDAIQEQYDLWHTSLIQVILFDLGRAEPAGLLILAHHMIMDGYSLSILVQDLMLACQQIEAGSAVQLTRKSAEFARWSRRLHAYVRSSGIQDEFPYWLEQLQPVPAVPTDYTRSSTVHPLFPDCGDVPSAQRLSRSFTSEQTAALLRRSDGWSYPVTMADQLLTALAYGFERWTGQRAVSLLYIGHGRIDPTEDSPVDVSRSVGCFAAVYPLRLDLGTASSRDEKLLATASQLRRVPNGGTAYELLRYAQEFAPLTQPLRTLQEPDVFFNYSSSAIGEGTEEVSPSSAALFNAVSASAALQPGLNRSRGTDFRSYLLEYRAKIEQGCLTFSIVYSNKLHRRETIETLVQWIAEALTEAAGTFHE